MKKGKIGSIFLISMLALAGIGISYAGFSDSIAIWGTVNTATVDIELTGWYSGTWVFKIWGLDDYDPPTFEYTVLDAANEILIYRGWVADAPTEAEVKAWAQTFGGDAELVAYSEAMPGTTHGDPVEEYDVDFIYDNLFPCIDFEADLIIHYAGSIPAIVDTAEIFSDDVWLQELWAMYQADPAAGFGAWVEAYHIQGFNATGAPTDNINEIVSWQMGPEVDPEGLQLHYCDYIYIKVVIHLPQDNDLQGLTGTFTGKIGVIQWNDACDDSGVV
jgi:hypothetical protein